MRRSKFKKNKKKKQTDAVKEPSNVETVKKDYKASTLENKEFENFYKLQSFIPENEFEEFIKILRSPLKSSFRITGSRSEAEQFRKIMKERIFPEITGLEVEGQTIEPPTCIPWYPDELAWQLDLSRKTIRYSDKLKKVHTFLISETECGNISRQEAVSMIPPLLFDIKPHHKILDMCAAPGSKTAQLIEAIHADDHYNYPEGLVVANDADNKRCYLMVHQVKRLQSPCFLITNHDAQNMPNFFTNVNGGPPELLQFDRVLCDVPCSGDGTLRKNPDIWDKWNPYHGYNLNRVQRNVLMRGISFLVVGGRLIYSTCSFNPIENEAVVAHALRQMKGTIELIDVSNELPKLKSIPGISSWKLSTKGLNPDIYNTYSEVPEKQQSIFRPEMFPPTDEEKEEFNLHRCVRILPHHQDTGGFFIAVFRKTGEISRRKPHKKIDISEAQNLTDTGNGIVEGEQIVQKNDNQDGEQIVQKSDNLDGEQIVQKNDNLDGNSDNSQCLDDTSENNGEKKINCSSDASNIGENSCENSCENSDKSKTDKRKISEEINGEGIVAGPHSKKKKTFGHKEEPYVFLTKDDPLLSFTIGFFGMDKIAVDQLLVRTHEGKSRNIYFVSEIVRDLIKENSHRIKIINAGVKVFCKSNSSLTKSFYRLAQEGISLSKEFVTKRKVLVPYEDIKLMLVDDCPFFRRMSKETESEIMKITADSGMGGALLKYVPQGKADTPPFEITLNVWFGQVSVRVCLNHNDRVHYMIMCGEDYLSKEEFLKMRTEAMGLKENDNTEENCDKENFEENDISAVNVENENLPMIPL